MNSVTWFEIPVNDLNRATDFYQKVFEVDMTIMEMGESLMSWFPEWPDGKKGITGTLIKTDGYTPSYQGTVVYFGVDDIDATLDKVKANGGKVVLPKTDIGEYGVFAQFEDTEGNRLALHSDGQ